MQTHTHTKSLPLPVLSIVLSAVRELFDVTEGEELLVHPTPAVNHLRPGNPPMRGLWACLSPGVPPSASRTHSDHVTQSCCEASALCPVEVLSASRVSPQPLDLLRVHTRAHNHLAHTSARFHTRTHASVHFGVRTHTSTETHSHEQHIDMKNARTHRRRTTAPTHTSKRSL